MYLKRCLWTYFLTYGIWLLTLPAASGDLHTGVEARGAGEVLNQDAMVALLDITVDVLLAECLQHSLDAVNTSQYSLRIYTDVKKILLKITFTPISTYPDNSPPGQFPTV